ncbi:hypothetical protein YSA_02177 [Pseudomonas putida ND6]|uniref:Uncharacterized protein n=1 Tax=Pseudomonas putida ND6 TaxID=231023 RepID=I3UR27_PSEPU|nr:hypothetical protein YSA_02177 [Pseudomonas putida ND6]
MEDVHERLSPMVKDSGHKLGLATKNKKRGDPKVAPLAYAQP